MSDFNNSKSGKNGKPFLISDTTVWFIFAIVVLLVIGSFFGYNFFTETLELKHKDLALWFIFMLFAAAISCFFNAITSLVSEKSRESRERNMVQEITDIFTKKTGEIKSDVNVALKQSDLVSGDLEDILRLLMSHSLLNGEITKIRILARDSGSFSEFFTGYFKDTPLECTELEVLIYNPSINKNNPIIDEWAQLFEAKNIKTLRIRRTDEIKRRSFFGMVVEFERFHSIGLIGFYRPRGRDGSNEVKVINNPYGVFSEENSILDVLHAYFNCYFEDATVLKEEYKNT